MATRISINGRNAACNGLVDLLDAGTGPGTIQIRTGTQPATPNDSATGTLLGTLTLSDPAFGNASAGVATASAITGDSSADSTGTAGWFRALDSDGNAVIDGSCGTSGSGADMILSSTSIVAGGTINISTWTVTAPAS